MNRLLKSSIVILALALFLIGTRWVMTVHAQVSTCVVTGTILKSDGTPAVGIPVTVVRYSKPGVSSSTIPVTRITNASGVVTLTIVRGSSAWVFAAAAPWNVSGGKQISVPEAATANLDDLASSTLIPATGLTVKDEGTSLASLIGTFNFVGAGVTAVQTSPGLATVTIGGASAAWGSITGTLSGQTDLQAALDLKQPIDADLTALAGLTSAADKLPYFSGAGTAAVADFTAAGRAILDDADASAQRVTLGLVIGTNVQAFSSRLSEVATIGTASQQIRVNGAGTALEYFTPAAGGDALTANPLSQFASTTSLQLLGVISNETGTGLLLFNDTPTLIAPLLGTPTSGVLTNLTGLPPTTGIVGWPANASGVLTNNGSGTLTWGAGGSGATTALDNLAAVAINTSLLPGGASVNLGSATLPFLASFTGSTTQYESVVSSAGLITHAALGSATNIALAFTAKGASGIQFNNPVYFPTGSAGVPSISFISGNTTGFYLGAGSSINVPVSGTNVLRLMSAEVRLANNVLFSWGSGTPEATAGDTGFSRNAAEQVQINNGNLNQWGSLFAGVRDPGTTTVTNGLTLGHQSTGTPAAGLGSAIAFNINSSTTADRYAAQLYSAWSVATDAARVARVGIASNVVGSTTSVDRFIAGGHTAVATDNTALSLFEVALTTLQGCSGKLTYTVYCTNGTDVQIRRGVMEYSAVNKAAAYTSETAILNEAASPSAGTLTAVFTIVTGTNKITLQVTPDTSLATPTSYYVKWELSNLSESAIAVL